MKPILLYEDFIDDLSLTEEEQAEIIDMLEHKQKKTRH